MNCDRLWELSSFAYYYKIWSSESYDYIYKIVPYRTNIFHQNILVILSKHGKNLHQLVGLLHNKLTHS